jgi:hypothetical protein
MEFFLFIGIVAFLVLLIVKQKKARPAPLNKSTVSPPKQATPKHSKANQDLDWLNARWAAAEAAKDSGNFSYFKEWYFHPATAAQLEKLKDEGASLLGEPTKGQATDALGMFEDADSNDIEVLRFFKKSKPRISNTEAKELIRLIFSEPESADLWSNRPPAGIVKIFCSIYGMKLPKGMTHTQAKVKIDDLISADEKMESVWLELEDVLDELDDAQSREDYSLKKPSTTQVASAAKSLLQGGHDIDTSSIVDRLIELYPTLER